MVFFILQSHVVKALKRHFLLKYHKANYVEDIRFQWLSKICFKQNFSFCENIFEDEQIVSSRTRESYDINNN